MVDGAGIERHLLRCLAEGRAFRRPFRHWRLSRVLPDEVCAGLLSLPLARRPLGDNAGRRETHNSRRLFFAPELCGRHRLCHELAACLRRPALVRQLELMCGLDLGGAFLRIEHCVDGAGFWLEPHTDIGAKLLTLQIYLSRGPDAKRWGTDLLDGAQRIVVTVPAVCNSALMFVPAGDTWHGFHKRPIVGIRTSLIVNYVKDEWRSRHELVDPLVPVKPRAVAATAGAPGAPHSGGGIAPVRSVISP